MKKNKKRWSAVLLAAAMGVGVFAFPMGTLASTSVKAQLCPQFTIVIDGVERDFFHADQSEVHPLVYDGTTYLPLRAIGELMGKNVNWDENTLTVTLSGSRTTSAVQGKTDEDAKQKQVTAQICDEFTIVVDGKTQTFTDASGNRTYPLLYEGSTYLPLRAIGSLMGKEVSWDEATKTVTLGNDNKPLVTDADSFRSSSTSSTTGDTSLEEAKQAAFAHAGVTEKNITVSKAKLDWDDGRQVYEVEFYTADGTEYEYEIDAKTGTVIKYDMDAESTGRFYQDNHTSSQILTMEEAKKLAAAAIDGAKTSHVVKAELDRDDGKLVYEIKLIIQDMEYELELDAASGKILSKEVESIDR